VPLQKILPPLPDAEVTKSILTFTAPFFVSISHGFEQLSPEHLICRTYRINQIQTFVQTEFKTLVNWLTINFRALIYLTNATANGNFELRISGK
jgi:hypothetical protein